MRILPSPPSTRRPSPVHETANTPRAVHPLNGSIPRDHSFKFGQSMSTHRGLPPPAPLTLPQPPHVGSGPHSALPSAASVGHVGVQQSQGPPSQTHYSQLPPPPPAWQNAEESNRVWLLAKTEEDRRRQEEERTRQEELRLEQRRMEYDILRTSLQGGIPPPMIPVVFAGMGGGQLAPAALEWAQQFLHSQAQQAIPPSLQALSSQAPPEHRRESSQLYSQGPSTGGMPPTPGNPQTSQSVYTGAYAGSPGRSRGYSASGSGGRPGMAIGSSTSTGQQMRTGQALAQGPSAAPQSQQQQQQPTQERQERQPSPPIYFHMWQPPAGSGQSAGSEESPTRKRKAAGPPSSQQRRSKSPPSSTQLQSIPPSTMLSNPPPGRRRGHSRQRSEMSYSTRPMGRSRAATATGGFGLMTTSRGDYSAPVTTRTSPIESFASLASQQQSFQSQGRPRSRPGAHPVSALLSEEGDYGARTGSSSGHVIRSGPATSDLRGQYQQGQQQMQVPQQAPGGSSSGGVGSSGETQGQ